MKTLLQWDQDLPEHVQAGTVLFQKEGALCLEAVEVLEKARASALAMAQQGAEEFELQKKKGYEEGLSAGKAAAAAYNVKTVLASLDYFEQSKNQLIQIVINCVRRFVMELPAQERFYQLVGKALDELKQQPRIILQVNPQDREAVEGALKRLSQLLPTETLIEVRAREELGSNSCVLESPLGLIDASLESQLAILEASLKGAKKSMSEQV